MKHPDLRDAEKRKPQRGRKWYVYGAGHTLPGSPPPQARDVKSYREISPCLREHILSIKADRIYEEKNEFFPHRKASLSEGAIL